MSKKTKKRQSRKKRSTSSSTQSAPPAGKAQVKVDTGFHPDYSETVKDLKRIGVLAGTFFVILIGLSFFLN
jgi:hypothetical protein